VYSLLSLGALSRLLILQKTKKAALMQLDDIASKTDTAARRLEIEQAWESCHFDRGYQHSLGVERVGGFSLDRVRFMGLSSRLTT